MTDIRGPMVLQWTRPRPGARPISPARPGSRGCCAAHEITQSALAHTGFHKAWPIRAVFALGSRDRQMPSFPRPGRASVKRLLKANTARSGPT